MSSTSISIRPLPVGAEIVGLRPGSEHDPAVAAQLYDAWLCYGFLLFRGVDSIASHLSLSRCFGELELHPVKEVRSDLDPLLIEIGGKRRARAYVFDDQFIRINRVGWHRDTAFTPDICKGAMLRMVNATPSEGETMLADTAMAYDDLSAAMKQRLEGLEYKATLRSDPVKQTRPGAFWTSARPATAEEDPEFFRDGVQQGSDDRYHSVIHPVVIIHPESGRKCIFLSPTYVDCFLGLEQEESDDLHRFLVDHMLSEKYVFKHRWTENEAIVWDNRRIIHAAAGNPLDEFRWGLRTTLAGPLRTGRYFDEAVAALTQDGARSGHVD